MGGRPIAQRWPMRIAPDNSPTNCLPASFGVQRLRRKRASCTSTEWTDGVLFVLAGRTASGRGERLSWVPRNRGLQRGYQQLGHQLSAGATAPGGQRASAVVATRSHDALLGYAVHFHGRERLPGGANLGDSLRQWYSQRLEDGQHGEHSLLVAAGGEELRTIRGSA